MNEVAVNETKAVAPVTQGGAWGSEDTNAADLVIPRMALAQATSTPCKEGNARPGEVLHSLTGEKLMDKGATIDLLPILTVNAWVVSELIVGKQQPEFVRIEAITAANYSDDWRYEKTENGKNLLFQKRLSALVLPVGGLDGFPYFIDFQKTNRKPGQVLSTIIQENKFRNQPACHRVVSVGTQLKTRDQNSWFIFTVTPSRVATPEEVAACRRWYDIFGKKAQEAALVEENAAANAEIPF